MRACCTAAILTLLVSGCGPTTVPTDASCETERGQVEVGRGGSRLRSLPRTGGEVDIIRGAQGGIHVVVGAWVSADVDLDLTMRYQLVEAGSLLGTETSVELRPALFAVDGARFVRHPDLIVLDGFSPSVDRFVGRTADLEVELWSADGTRACDSRTVTLVDPGG